MNRRMGMLLLVALAAFAFCVGHFSGSLRAGCDSECKNIYWDALCGSVNRVLVGCGC